MWDRARILLLIVLAATWFAPSASATAKSSEGKPPPAPSGKPRHVAAAGQDTAALALDLLRKQPSGNAVLSPDSIATSLAMVGEGAAGSTARQVAHVLHLPSAASFGALGSLRRTIAAEESAAAKGDPEPPKLTIADGLFVAEGFTLEAPFLTALRDGFAAAPKQVAFASNPSQAVQTVNEWINTNTQGLIPSALESIPPTTRLLLADAIYLNAKWRQGFPEALPRPFQGPHSQSDVPFMEQRETLSYGAGEGYEAVELPYRSSTLSMLVVLPVKQSLSSLLGRLSGTRLDRLVKRMRRTFVHLSIPKFHISAKLDLKGLLESLGMRSPFDQSADFSGIAHGGPLHIGSVEHAADIRVFEGGTVAAATTIVRLEPLGPKGGVDFIANRPFLYFLRDDRTGAVLFAGRLEDAAAAQS